MKNSRALAILLAVLALGSCGIFRICNASHFKNLIPSEIEVADTVVVDGESGGIEGCGVAIFRVGGATLASLRANGIHALDRASRSRKKKLLSDEYEEYSPWKETPYPETGDGMTLADRWLGGFACANIDSDLDNSIHRALRSNQSYYATTHEAGLIVIPHLGLVVYSYFG